MVSLQEDNKKETWELIHAIIHWSSAMTKKV